MKKIAKLLVITSSLLPLSSCRSTGNPDGTMTENTELLANMNGTDYTSRNGAPDSRQMYDNGQRDSRLGGITFLRPVLSGVLYRSGIGNTKRGLTRSQLDGLCSLGFSKALIVDFKDNGGTRGTTNCGSNSIDYSRVSSRKTARDAMRAIYDVIKNGSGPVLAHCRNGVHASNTIAAKALVRFCGWSVSAAKEYWEATRNRAPCGGGCRAWIDNKFRGFYEGDNGMTLTAAEKSAICPNP